MNINSVPSGKSKSPFVEKRGTERRTTERRFAERRALGDTVSIPLDAQRMPGLNSENTMAEIQLSGRSEVSGVLTGTNTVNGKTWKEVAEIPDESKFGLQP